MGLKLISLNIEGDKHWRRLLPFLDQERPDVVCLQELFQPDLDRLGAFTTIHYRPTVNYRGSLMGPAILTSLPVKSINEKFYLGSADNVPVFTQPDSDNRVVLWLTVTKNNQDFTVATTHFTWTPDGRPNPKQRRDLTGLITALEGIPEFVIGGDFNAPRRYSAYQTLAKKFTDHTPPAIKTTVDPRLHYANRENPGQLALVVDHLFSTPHYRAAVTVRCGLSDHCALIAEIKKPAPL